MKKKIKYFLLTLGLLALVLTALLFFTNFYMIFLGPLEKGLDVDNNYGDVILVLGGGLRKGREIGFSTEERLLLAIELYKQKKRMIIVSDGSLYPRSPAIKKITNFLTKNGVEKEYIHLEGKSQTTFDSFYYTQEMLEKMKSQEVIVCTSPYHQERAQMILDHLKLNNFKIARMTNSEIYQSRTIKQRLRNSWLIFREYMAILKFKIFKR
jgi:SanA protein